MRRFTVTCALSCGTALGLPVLPACVDPPPPCEASQVFEGVGGASGLTLPIPEGGRAFVTLPHVDGVGVVVDGLAPGFSAAEVSDDDGGTTFLVKAPYDLSGTIPARFVATCSANHDSATAPLMLEVRAPRVHEVAATSTGPSARSSAAVTVVGGRNLFVAGGSAAGEALGDAWVLDLEGEAWRPLTMSALPSAVHAAALDDHSVVVVGAADGAGFIVDVDVASASHLSASGALPSDTLGGSFAFIGGAFVSLCGVDVDGGAAGESCSVSSLVMGMGGGAWTLDAPTGFAPAGRRGAAFGVDDEMNRVVLFGGARDDGPGKDTWQLDAADVKNGNITFSHLAEHGDDPPARIDACGVVDPVSRRFFVFGGLDADGEIVDVAYALDLDDADADHPAKWRPLHLDDVPHRAGCFATWDATRNRILLGFGHDDDGEHANLYAVDL